MKREFLMWGALFGLLAVFFGALGAHALEPLLSEKQLSSFETGVRYQMYHALVLLLIANFKELHSKLLLGLLLLGILLFSFSIYLLNLRFLMEMEYLTFLGPVTPLGGLLLIFAWFFILVKAIKIKS